MVKTRTLGMIQSSLVVLIVSTLFPSKGRAEEHPGTVDPTYVGSKVRFHAPTIIEGPVQGTVIEMDDRSLLISTENQRPFRVSRQAITQLEVAVGRRRNARKGLVIGALAGAVFVGSLAIIPRDSFCPPAEPDAQVCLDARKVGLAVGLPLMALEGAGIGALIKSDTWSPVGVDKVSMSVAPSRGPGLGLTLSLRF